MTTSNNTATRHLITYRRETVDGLSIFYREGGDPSLPTILFLHGFPSSSHMYRELLHNLAHSFHVIAPDYPGFGLSDVPALHEYNYTFHQLSLTMEHFIDQLHLTSFHLFVQDYGSPVGFRIAARRPQLVQSLIIQNANAYLEGLGPNVQRLGAFAEAGDAAGLRAATLDMMTYESIRHLYLAGAAHPERISPDAWLSDHYFMERPGSKEVQVALSDNYPSNFSEYVVWQQYFRKHQPSALILWGKNDQYFIPAGAEGYKKDLKKIELHLFDGGHFIIEEYQSEIAELVSAFLQRLSIAI